MKIVFHTMMECSRIFLTYLENYEDKTIKLEMKQTFAKLTNDVFFATHFGIICNSLEDPSNIFYLMGKRGADFGGFWFKFKFVLIKMCPALAKLFDQSVSRFFMDLVTENIQARRAQKIIRPDLIQLLMETSKDVMFENGEESDTLTLSQITSFVLVFFGAGFDSVSTLLSFVAYELALHPDVQNTLQEEVDDAWKECNGGLTYKILLHMKYLDMVISDRRCVKPYIIHPEKPEEVPIHLKTGDAVWVPLFALQRDATKYSEPDQFLPERFSPENVSNLNPYMYMPFGIGPRHCIGNRFALLEAKIMIFQIMRKYSFTTIEKTVIPIRLARRNFQAIPKDGFWLGLQRRC